MAENIPCQLMDLKDNHVSDAMDAFMDCKYVAVGSPTLNSNMLPTVAGFLVYMRGLSPKNQGRVGIAFGSYGWGGGSVKQISAKLEEAGFTLVNEGIAKLWVPDEANLEDCKEYGRQFAQAL
jgi:flavorubredoxin